MTGEGQWSRKPLWPACRQTPGAAEAGAGTAPRENGGMQVWDLLAHCERQGVEAPARTEQPNPGAEIQQRKKKTVTGVNINYVFAFKKWSVGSLEDTECEFWNKTEWKTMMRMKTSKLKNNSMNLLALWLEIDKKEVKEILWALGLLIDNGQKKGKSIILRWGIYKIVTGQKNTDCTTSGFYYWDHNSVNRMDEKLS